MFRRWQAQLPEGSLFRKPLVCEITLVLIIKLILLTALWFGVFKPLVPSAPPDITNQLLHAAY